MDWQQIVALAVVLATAGIMLGRLRRGRGSAGACHCGGDSDRSRVSVTYRARKGERPQIIVKGR
ncbi:MAG: hypothetical protein ACYDC1_12280 [Limisphaerales bacterium]